MHSYKRKHDYKRGMRQLGIPSDEVTRLSHQLEIGKLPHDVLDSIVLGHKKFEQIHSDYYPWHASTYDEIAWGLEESKINSESIWYNAEKYVKKEHKKAMPPECDIHQGYAGAITNLLEQYALIKFHTRETIKEYLKINDPYLYHKF